MKISLKVLPVNYGDALILRVEDKTITNIFVDSGFVGTYRTVLKAEIKKIIEKNEKIDLFAISHVDQDHIGGLLTLIKDNSINWKSLIENIWFNYFEEKIYINFSNKISYSQGIELKELLIEEGKLNNDILFYNKEVKKINDISFTIISPGKDDVDKFLLEMKNKEKSIKASRKISSTVNDYSFTVEELFERSFEENLTLENLASLSFLVAIKDVNILFAGDASAKVMFNSLKNLGYSKEEKLKLDYFKLSHHGSKNNTSLELLEIIKCNKFIISSNGNHANNPTKTALSWILKNPERNMEETISFIFNYNNTLLRNIFSEKEREIYNFECFFPKGGENGYTIKIK